MEDVCQELTYGYLHWILLNVSEVSMSSAPLTDHFSLHLELKPKLSPEKININWKFNADLLKSEHYCKKNERIIVRD